MQLLISDTNILIDLEEGKLMDELFRLLYEFAVPDILFAEELEAQHSHLLDMGLSQGELTSATLHCAVALIQRCSGVSRNDCFALALARQEQCPLLTGDQRLRAAADREGVEVMGTLWIVNQLVCHQIITREEAKTAYARMRENGRRLPWQLALSSLDRIDTHNP